MRASPRQPLILRQRATAAITPTSSDVRRPAPSAGRARPPERAETAEPPLLLAPLAAAHALLLLLDEPAEPEAARRRRADAATTTTRTAQARVAAEPRRLPAQPAELPLAVALALLDLLLGQRLELGLPLVAEVLRVVPPARALAALRGRRVVGVLRSACRAAETPAWDEAAGLAGLLLEAQDGLVDGVGHGRDPLAVESEVCAGLFGEGLCCSWGVQEGPLEPVGIYLRRQVDVEVDDAAVGIIRTEIIRVGRYRRRRRGHFPRGLLSRRWSGMAQL